MKTITVSVLLVLVSAFAQAGDHATCILDKMPGMQNDAAAYAVSTLCLQKNPGGFSVIEQGSGRGLFSYDSGAECAAKKAAGTPSLIGGRLIYVACNKLYDKPKPQVGMFDDLVNK